MQSYLLSLPLKVGKLTVVRLIPTSGRYEAHCECGGATTLNRRELQSGNIIACPKCMGMSVWNVTQPSAKAERVFRTVYTPVPKVSPMSYLGRRYGAVEVKKIVSPDGLLGNVRVLIKCGRCYQESETTIRTLKSRENFMHGETDCGCSRREKVKATIEAARMRQETRKTLKAIRTKVRDQKAAERDLTGRRVANWVVVRAAKRREANRLASPGRKWVVRCTCGDEVEYVKTTGMLNHGTGYCRVCRPSKRRTRVGKGKPRPALRSGVIS